MPLDATIGASTANSYPTLSEFEDALAARLHVPAVVTSASDEQKENALMMATALFEANVCILGVRTTLNQALIFPRTGLLNRNGDPVDTATIPAIVKYIIFELARLLLVSDLTLQSTAAAKGILEMKAGPVAFKFKDGLQWTAIPPSILAYLPKHWLCPTAVSESQVPILEVI